MAVIHHLVRYATTPIKAAASWQQLFELCYPSDQVHLLGRLLWSSSHRAHRHGRPRADGYHWHRDLQPHSSHDRLHQQEALLGRRQPHPVCHHGWRPKTQRWDEGVARLKNSCLFSQWKLNEEIVFTGMWSLFTLCYMSAAVTWLAAPQLLCRVGQSVIEVRCGYLSRSSVLRSHPRSNGADFVWGFCLLDWREVQISATCSQDNRRSRDRAPQLLASHQIHQGLPLPAPARRYEVHLALVFILSSGAERRPCAL